MKKRIGLILAIFMLASFSLLGLVACGGGGSDVKKVYLITMDQIDAHWGQVNAGATDVKEKYKGDVKFDYIWTAPYNKDANAQINYLNAAVTAGADVIMIAPSDAAASKSAIDAAAAKGVKFIYVDAVSDSDKQIQIVATNNEAAGKKAGNEMKAALAAEGITTGKIGILFPDNSSTVNARAKGFKSAFEGTTFTFDEKTTSATSSASVNAAAFVTAGCVAIFATNETTTVGLGSVDRGIPCAGFDASAAVMTAIENEFILFAIAQDPFNMGKIGMESAIKILEGKESEITVKNVDTGSIVVKKAT